jgi:thioredoxin 1
MININFFSPKTPSIFAPLMKYTIIALLSLYLYSCQSTSKSSNIDVEAFNTAISQGANIQLVDVRTPEEFLSGHIKNALNIDVNGANFEADLASLYKDIPVYVYCHSGSRSADAANQLLKMGFKQVFNLNGGIMAWKNSNMPVVESVAKPVSAQTHNSDDVESFRKDIKGEKLVLVDFSAVWCPPCQKMKPYVEYFKESRKDDVIIYTIDTDKEPEISKEYNIQSLPTIMMFKNNKMVYQNIGYMSEEDLSNAINQNK